MYNKNNEQKNNKIQWIINLRAIACIFVIMIHVIAGWIHQTNIQLSSGRWFLNMVVFQVVIRIAIPCFIMISGYLLLDPSRNLNIKKLKKYIARILCLIFMFGGGYLLLESLITKNFNLFKLVMNILEGDVWVHLWYLYMLLGLYIVTPILRNFIKNADNETIKFIMISLFIITMLIPTINEVFNINISEFYLESFKYIFIYLLGYYLGHTDIIIKDKVIYVCGVIGIIGYLLLSYFLKINSQTNMFILFESTLVFRLFSNKKIFIKDNKLISLISRYSLGIYLVHQFYLNLLYKVLNIFPSILPIFIGEICILILVLILSLLTSVIMYRLPFIKKLFE